MSKMSELHATYLNYAEIKEVIDSLGNGVYKNINEVHKLKKAIKYMKENHLFIKIYYSDDEETGMRAYDFENMQKDFDKKMKELEVDAEMRQEGWNDKQRDYAMDNMTNENLSLNDEECG